MLRHWKNFITLLHVWMIVMLALASCSPAPPAPGSAPSPQQASVTLTFGALEAERAYYEPLIARFNADNPSIRVQFVALNEALDHTDDPDAALQAVATLADTALIRSFTVALARNPSAAIRDLTPLLDTDPTFDRADFYPGAFVADPQTGATYAVAREVGVRLLVYNQALWAQRGLTPPKPDWTWDDLLAAAEQLAQKQGDTVAVYGFVSNWGSASEVLAAVFAAAGINLLAPQPPTQRLDQPAAVAALERVARLVASGAVYLQPATEPGASINTAAVTEIIRTGKVAMWPADMAVETPAFPVGVAALPATGLPWFAGSSHYVMSAGAQQPAAAWCWLAFLSRQMVGAPPLLGLQGAQVVPARPSLAEQSGYWRTLEANTGIPGIGEVVRAALATPLQPRAIDRSGLRAVDSAFQAVITTRQPAQQALMEAQATLEQQLAQRDAIPSPTPGAAVQIVATPLPAPPEGVTAITFRFQGNRNNGAYDKALRRLAETFTQQHPALAVNLKPFDMFAGQSLFDVAATADCFSWEYPSGSKDVLTATLDLQPLIDADPTFDLADYPPQVLNLFRHNGTLHGLPNQVGFRRLYYNKTAFDARGLAYPRGDWTLDEFLHAAEQLTYEAGGVKHYGFASWDWQPGELRYFFDRFEAVAVRGNAAAPQPNYTDPKVVQALRFYVDLLRNFSPHTQIDGYITGKSQFSQQNTQAFVDLIRIGRIGMWFKAEIFREGYYEEWPYEAGVAPPPLQTGILSPNEILKTGLYISATTQHADAC